MSILKGLQSLFQRVTADSVSCGTLALFAAAIGLLVLMMQMLTKNPL
jgi:hypothetical protein